MGSIDYPFNPISVALGAEASFVARTIDSDRKHLTEVLRQAAAHEGSALVEIYQNCNIFNDGAWEPLKDAGVREDNLIRLEHGKPIRFGANGQKGVARRDGRRPARRRRRRRLRRRLPVGPRRARRRALHGVRAVAAGRLRHAGEHRHRRLPRRARPVYDHLLAEQLERATAKGRGDLATLLAGRDTWTIPG